MTTDRAERFLQLHQRGNPLIMPNAWDQGSAKLLASLGFAALATTSSGFAATLGRVDGGATCDEVLAHGAALCAAVEVPVSADFEDGFAAAPEDVAANVRRAAATGLAGCSIEDYVREDGVATLADAGHAVDRVRAAVDAAHGGPARLVVTARAENFLRGNPDLADTIARLQAYQEAGADVLFAPGLPDVHHIRAVVEAVDAPVNVLVRPGYPPISELAAMGVARISVGGSFAWVVVDAVIRAATELRDAGTYGYAEVVPGAVSAARAAFSA